MTNEKNIYEKTSDGVEIKIVRIGNIVKVKVSATVQTNDVFVALVTLSDFPAWAKPSFEELGTVTSASISSDLQKQSGETSFRVNKHIDASLVKLEGNIYKIGVSAVNATSVQQNLQVFMHYICE